ncbi:MAG: hypothetical protein ACLPY1_21575 [Terracidiphilus sp.]
MDGMETPQEFTTRARGIQHQAIRLSRQANGDNAEINRWMAVAKQRGMTWLDGLYFAVARMKGNADEAGTA